MGKKNPPSVFTWSVVQKNVGGKKESLSQTNSAKWVPPNDYVRKVSPVRQAGRNIQPDPTFYGFKALKIAERLLWTTWNSSIGGFLRL